MTQKTPKTVMVTGANGALGKVVVKRFLEAGCQVIGVQHAHSAGATATPGSALSWVTMDVSDSKSVKAGIAQARQSLGGIDALVHCAGGFRYVNTDEVTDEDLDFLMNVNLRSVVLLTRELLPEMKQRNFGRIVYVSARATLHPSAGMGIYSATKAGINQLTESAAAEVRAFDINVNSVLPTIIDTPANRKDMPKADFSTWVAPEALAEVIFSLTQPWGKPIHGALIPVSGRL